jgi:8-amino-3,8-dideoxy-alpha-D-manno-octulosonate transaminase
MLGGPARIDELKAVADRHGIPLIEDCAQAFGATYKGRGVGGFGAAGTFSFNEYKTITCGDGGMIVTDDEALYERSFAMHDQGHAPDRLESKYAPRPFLGMNFRMTELSGAVLLGQLRKLDLITSHLRANKAIVKDMLEEVPVIGFRELTDP